MRLDIGQSAINIAETGADFARSALRVLAHALPIFLLFLVNIKLGWLLVEDQPGDQIGGYRDPLKDEDREERHDPDPAHIHASIVSNPCTNAHQFGIDLVAIKCGARRVHARVPFFSASRRSSSRNC